MSFMGFFPSDRERRIARDEAEAALERYGDHAEEALRVKARQSPSSERRRLYKVALRQLKLLRRR